MNIEELKQIEERCKTAFSENIKQDQELAFRIAQKKHIELLHTNIEYSVFTEISKDRVFSKKAKHQFKQSDEFKTKLAEALDNDSDLQILQNAVSFKDLPDSLLPRFQKYYNTELNSEHIRPIANVRLNQWFNEDEINKVALCTNSVEKEQKLWEWEDNKDIMGDLSIIWKVLDQNVNWTDAEKVYTNYNILLNCFCDEEYVRKENNPILTNLANYYRLFRVLRGYYAPGHIDYTKNMNGAWFSWREEHPAYFHYMLDPALVRVLGASNIEEMLLRIKNEVRKSVLKSGIVENYVPCINDDNFKSISYLKLWLTSKVLWAEKYDLLLSYYDGAGIAAWDDCQRNKIDVDLPFSVANSHCGYAICRPANRIAYVANDKKDKEEYFDTMISVNKTIDEVNSEINDLFLNFLSSEEV